MPYHQLFYHIVWATKNREPILTEAIEPIIYRYLNNKALSLEATLFALNGFRDHVHMIATIPPKIAIATFIGQVKGVASARFNHEHPDMARFYWQEEYAIFSFDRKRLSNHVEYVERQKQHHLNSTLIPALERCADEDPKMIREESAEYVAQAWEDALE